MTQARKGKRFDDISDIQRNVTRLLNSISKEDFLQSFQDVYNSPQWCMIMGGDYFEGQSRVAIHYDNAITLKSQGTP
ncbi:hypothetical protein TNCV_4385611 [Trichonephila clavipes]|nr:hypothetical protein TNCV_4385611 [Trichonephila clavipes]